MEGKIGEMIAEERVSWPAAARVMASSNRRIEDKMEMKESRVSWN